MSKVRRILVSLVVLGSFSASSAVAATPAIDSAQISVISPRVHADSAGCWTGASRERYWYLRATGTIIAYIKIVNRGWCGNGRRITRDYGWHGYYWAAYPFYITGAHARDGWSDYPRVRHGAIWGSVGYEGRVLRSGRSGVRITAAGYIIAGY